MSQFLGEFIGTLILILFGCGVNAGVTLHLSKAKDAGWIVIALGWGLAVMLGVYAVGDISGAHLNPAVTLGFAIVGAFPWAEVPSYILAQMLGAMAGATLVWLQYLPHWSKTAEPADKLGIFSTAPAVPARWANLLSELLGTFALVLALMFIGANNFTEGLNPLIVGLLIVAIGVSLGGSTGYAINPARDLGPRIAHFLLPIKGKGGSDWAYSWIPVLGPAIGGLMGGLFYQAVFSGAFSIAFWITSGVTVLIIVLAVLEEG